MRAVGGSSSQWPGRSFRATVSTGAAARPPPPGALCQASHRIASIPTRHSCHRVSADPAHRCRCGRRCLPSQFGRERPQDFEHATDIARHDLGSVSPGVATGQTLLSRRGISTETGRWVALHTDTRIGRSRGVPVVSRQPKQGWKSLPVRGSSGEVRRHADSPCSEARSALAGR